MKTKIINIVLWSAFILAMAASIQHLAWVFGTVERTSWEWLGWIPAVAVDAGLAALAYTIQQRKRAKRATGALWAGVAGFALISALANFYHGLAVEMVATPAIHSLIVALPIQVAKVVILSATLPIMYIFLGEIVSGDDATAAEKAARQAEREQVRADKQAETQRLQAERERLQAERERLEAERANTEAQRLLLEAERQAAEEQRHSLEAEQTASTSEEQPAEYVLCPECPRTFANQNALNAHMRQHANGREK